MSPRNNQPATANPASNSVPSNGSKPLPPRELEVAQWIGRGKGNEEIAKILERSTPTVKKHVHHILEKLGVETRPGVGASRGQDNLFRQQSDDFLKRNSSPQESEREVLRRLSGN